MSSRIYRTFEPTEGMFEVTAVDRTFTDEQITSITITRGNSGPHPSFSPATIEVGLTGAVRIGRDEDLHCIIAPLMASRIAGRSPYTGSDIMHRFRGRKAIAEVEDLRWNRTDGIGKFNTKVMGSAWTALLSRAERTNSPSSKSVSAVVTALKHPDLANKYDVTYSYLNDFDSLAKVDPFLDASEVIDKYANKLHTLIEHQRSGDVRVVSNVRRRNNIMAAGPVWTLPRAHALSPAKWSSPAEMATTQYIVRYTTSTDVPYEQEWPLSDALTLIALRSEVVDLEHIKPSLTDFVSRDILMRSINNYTNLDRSGVDSVTIDMGSLWRLGTDSAIRTMVEVLKMEEGAAMHLGADWPQAVRGPYFANQITEKITPDSWQVTLDLFHARYVVGLGDPSLPTPQPIIWDAANTIWNATPGKWN